MKSTLRLHPAHSVRKHRGWKTACNIDLRKHNVFSVDSHQIFMDSGSFKHYTNNISSAIKKVVRKVKISNGNN